VAKAKGSDVEDASSAIERVSRPVSTMWEPTKEEKGELEVDSEDDAVCQYTIRPPESTNIGPTPGGKSSRQSRFIHLCWFGLPSLLVHILS
jgi:hypothetical protein